MFCANRLRLALIRTNAESRARETRPETDADANVYAKTTAARIEPRRWYLRPQFLNWRNFKKGRGITEGGSRGGIRREAKSPNATKFTSQFEIKQWGR